MKQSSGKDRQPQKGKNRQRRPQAISNRACHAQKKSSDGKNLVGKYSSSKLKAYHGDRDYSGRVRFEMNENQLRAMVVHAMLTARRGEAGAWRLCVISFCYRPCAPSQYFETRARPRS